MMEPIKSARKGDSSDRLPDKLSYDPSRWRGTWYNCLADTQQIAQVEILEKEGKWYIRIFGVCEPQLCDWGLAELTLFNNAVDSAHVEGFLGEYDLGFCEIQLAGVEKQNVLVISTYTTFKDGSNRHRYFSREYYYQKK